MVREEFGPFLLHTDGKGKLLDAPIVAPGLRRPRAPSCPGVPPNLGRSNGFEAMALTTDGKRLVPVLEGPVTGQNPLERTMYEYDLKAHSGTPAGSGSTRWPSRGRVDLGHAALDDQLIVTERDNGQGPVGTVEEGVPGRPSRGGRDRSSVKHQFADLLRSTTRRRCPCVRAARRHRLGDPFSMPYYTIESVLPVSRVQIAIVNDTNFGSTGRNPCLPDYSDFIVVDLPR